MANASYVVYIDESGDEGFKFTGGSSHWFVLSAVITRKQNDLPTVKLVDDVRALLKRPPKKPLHFSKMRHEHRVPYIDRICKASLRTVSVLVHKPSLLEPEIFQEPHRLYRYIVRFLLERVSWFCRDHHHARYGGDGSAEIVFSNRSSMSYDEIRNYLNLLKAEPALFGCTIDWNAIKPDQISTFTPGKRMGLQIADAVASSVSYGVNPSQYGYTEPRYITTLKPVVYRRGASYMGYGLKFFPKEVQRLIDSDASLRWVKDVFGG